ncbi:hypothetical protein GCM10027093_09110 [Paraburkholderia jirisanensis]
MIAEPARRHRNETRVERARTLVGFNDKIRIINDLSISKKLRVPGIEISALGSTEPLIVHYVVAINGRAEANAFLLRINIGSNPGVSLSQTYDSVGRSTRNTAATNPTPGS